MSLEAEITVYIAGAILVLPFAITGATYALASSLEGIKKVVEYVSNNPYETLLRVAGVTALGVGTYRHVERKLHVAETLDDFVKSAKRSEKPVDVQFQWGRGLERYAERIMLRSGKTRYEDTGRCDVFGSNLARGKATGVLSLVETALSLAESLEKNGLEVRVNGRTIDDARKYQTTCREWIEKGYAFIAG